MVGWMGGEEIEIVSVDKFFKVGRDRKVRKVVVMLI